MSQTDASQDWLIPDGDWNLHNELMRTRRHASFFRFGEYRPLIVPPLHDIPGASDKPFARGQNR